MIIFTTFIEIYHEKKLFSMSNMIWGVLKTGEIHEK